jgi:hypothetical protein
LNRFDFSIFDGSQPDWTKPPLEEIREIVSADVIGQERNCVVSGFQSNQERKRRRKDALQTAKDAAQTGGMEEHGKPWLLSHYQSE